MADRAVIAIEIDDSKYKEFQGLFKKYQDALEKLPAQWQLIHGAASDVSDKLESANQSAERRSIYETTSRQDLEKLRSATKATAAVWATIADSAFNVGRHLDKATGHLLRWGTLTTAFTGLLGVGSLFGIDRLAQSISMQRRASMGLGLSYGQNLAFNANYGQLINPGTLLGNIATAKYDVTSSAYVSLLSMGISPEFIKNHNTFDIAQKALEIIPRLFIGKQKGMRGSIASSHMLDAILPEDDRNTLLNASDDELDSMSRNSIQSAKTLDLQVKTQKAWADFNTALDRSSKNIQTILGEKLSILEPDLEKLVNDVSDDAVQFLKSDTLKGWIDDLDDGLKYLDEEIKKPEFKENVNEFFHWIGDAAKSTWEFVKSFDDSPLGKLANDIVSGSEGAPASGKAASPYGGLSPFVPMAPMGLSPGSPWSQSPSRGSGQYFPQFDIPGGAPRAPGGVGSLLNGFKGDPNYPNTIEGRTAFIRDYAQRIGINPDFAVDVATNEGLVAGRGANQASTIDIGANGVPFSYGDFQMNYAGGLGIAAAQSGIGPNDPLFYQKGDIFALEHMRHHGVGPWRGDRGLERWRASGRLPTIYITPKAGASVPASAFQAAQPATTVPTK